MTRPAGTLGQLARLFLRLGTTSFGGPAAHTALMQEEVVARRRWMTIEEFLDLVALTQLIPGPNSTELAMLIGQRRHGKAGLLVAGFCFLLPAVILVSIIAWLYARQGRVRLSTDTLVWVRPVVIGILAHALIAFGKATLRTRRTFVVAVVALLAAFSGLHDLVILALAALLSLGIARAGAKDDRLRAIVPAPLAIFWAFFKIGGVLYGSGYVLVALLRSELVERLHWLTATQLLDGLAVGQVTPGPLFTTATFLGWILGGPLGAATATMGIFLPAFLLILIVGPLLPRFAKTSYGRPLLDGLGAASVALLAHSAFQIARASLASPTAAIVAAASFVVLLLGVGATWVVALALVAGFFV